MCPWRKMRILSLLDPDMLSNLLHQVLGKNCCKNTGYQPFQGQAVLHTRTASNLYQAQVRSVMEYWYHLWDVSALYQLATLGEKQRLINNDFVVESKLPNLKSGLFVDFLLVRLWRTCKFSNSVPLSRFLLRSARKRSSPFLCQLLIPSLMRMIK